MTHALTYLSLGAGVQSSALLIMSALGLYDCPRADVAIFADTQDEPAWVYEHLERLKAWSSIRIDTVSIGRLSDMAKAPRTQHVRAASIPAYTEGPDGRPSMIRRQCTATWKIEPIEKHVRRLLGVAPGHRVPKLQRARARSSASPWTRPSA